MITQEEQALIGKDVEASMDGLMWWAGRLDEIIDLFVPYKVYVPEFGEQRNFIWIRPAPVEACRDCGGDGRETCNNPDHGFISAVGGELYRLGCPVCGHDPNHKVKNGGLCETCEGSGRCE